MVLMKMEMLFQLSLLPKLKKTGKGNTRNTKRMAKGMREKNIRGEEETIKREIKVKEGKDIEEKEKKGLNIQWLEEKGKIQWRMVLFLTNRSKKEKNIKTAEVKGLTIQWLEEKGKILWLTVSNLKGNIQESEGLVKTQWLMDSNQKNKEGQCLEEKDKTQWPKDLFQKSLNHHQNRFLI